MIKLEKWLHFTFEVEGYKILIVGDQVPFIHIKSLRPKSDIHVGEMLVELCEGLAEISNIKPEDVCATFEIIPPHFYAHGKSTTETQPDESHPPLVDLLAWQGRSLEAKKKMLMVSAEILSKYLQIPKHNIFINFREATSGHVFTEGDVI